MRIYRGCYGSDFPRASVLGQIEQANIEAAMLPLHRWYGVSTGDGNNGVSHMYPDYYVWTNDPWRLAELAAESAITPLFHDELEYSGEADYCISAGIYDPDLEYNSFILEVFPEEDDHWRLARERSYLSIEQALS